MEEQLKDTDHFSGKPFDILCNQAKYGVMPFDDHYMLVAPDVVLTPSSLEKEGVELCIRAHYKTGFRDISLSSIGLGVSVPENFMDSNAVENMMRNGFNEFGSGKFSLFWKVGEDTYRISYLVAGRFGVKAPHQTSKDVNYSRVNCNKVGEENIDNLRDIAKIIGALFIINSEEMEFQSPGMFYGVGHEQKLEAYNWLRANFSGKFAIDSDKYTLRKSCFRYGEETSEEGIITRDFSAFFSYGGFSDLVFSKKKKLDHLLSFMKQNLEIGDVEFTEWDVKYHRRDHWNEPIDNRPELVGAK